MPKNTHAQEAATGSSDSYEATVLDAPEQEQPVRVRRAALGDVDREPDDMHSIERVEEGTPSVGSNSESSSENEKNDSESAVQAPRKPALVANPFVEEETETDSTVRSTGGDGPKTTRQQSARKSTPKKSARSLDDEFS